MIYACLFVFLVKAQGNPSVGLTCLVLSCAASLAPTRGVKAASAVQCFACCGLGALQARHYNYSSIKQCMPACRQQGYSLAIITPDFACRCAIATPDAMAEVQETECRTGGKGATVFYDHDGTLHASVLLDSGQQSAAIKY